MNFSNFPLFPEQASSIAQDIDLLYFFLIAVSSVMSIAIFALVFVFAIKYRRRAPDELPTPILGSLRLELFWSITPLFFLMAMFGWAAALYFRNSSPPEGAMDIYVVGKQWMWKLQHPDGHREINELHIPVGKPIRLTMATEDVIHSFYIPAFRVKQDVVPGRYSQLWFTPTKTGQYHLFCAEYCGTQHSGMIGSVYVMQPNEYEDWLTGRSGSGTPAQNGERLFTNLGCSNCHQMNGQGRCPTLQGVYKSDVQFEGGGTAVADEAYIRESILNPGAHIVRGYTNLMPTFQGQVSEEGILDLIAYVKSLTPQQPATPAGNKPAPGAATRGRRKQ